MKRAADEQTLKEQPTEERVVPPAKPLLPEEVELVGIHRDITQHLLGTVALDNGYSFVKLGLPSLEYTLPEGADDVDYDAQYARLRDMIDAALFPDELLQAEYVNVGGVDSAGHEVTDVKHSIRKIDEVMEREAKYVEEDDPKAAEERADDAMEVDTSMYNDNDDHLVGDYNYSFCDEDDGF
ncbi:cyclopropane-fatty-acyl-phospholipid synthase, putative [Babesia ovata]|uniref:Cyclopropane-fatty-acyl-phospholipid synthase, putative n=1 Tax=Babesia ovata TaxID=189622 RepID=A0A2H6K6E4_9APIC|nr:cyclopropane-fatty-acyl-phospholipid synthase, putative [Babesia ovata]GBE58564.1 cyclopropane-fatty-acyl-phospholipid synthase, putative [Babesia ovata]